MTLTGHTNMVTGLAFSADGLRLATASWDSTANIWDLISCQVVATIIGLT